MKLLHEFEVIKYDEIEVPEETDKGTLIKKEKIPSTVYLALKALNRSEREESDIMYSVYLSDLIKKGVLTKALLEKTYANSGGILNEDEKKKYSKMYQDFAKIQSEWQLVRLRASDPDASQEDKDRVEEVYNKFITLYSTLQQFELEHSEIFSNTADHLARNKTIAWLVIKMAYYRETKDSEWKEFFKGNSFDDKLDYYDEISILEEDDWRKKAVDKIGTLVSCWYMGSAKDSADFKKIEELLQDASNLSDDYEDIDLPQQEESEEVDG